MMLIYLRDGECVEVEGAMAADRRNDLFVCFDDRGREVASFDWPTVEAYTLNDQMARILLDDACEDIKVIPEKPSEAEGTHR